jgi:CubicO group peptidase (beta-lactamase class C family)
MSQRPEESAPGPKPKRSLRFRSRAICFLVAVCATTLFSVPLCRSDDLPTKIDEYLKKKVTEQQFRGRVLVAHGDHVLVRADYGQGGQKQVLSNKNPPFRFPVGSIAEQFIAVALLQLEERGKIKLDESICSHISDCPSDWKDVRLVNLLTHTSGLPSLKEPSLDQVDLAPPQSAQELVARIREQPLESQPGSEVKYSKFDFILLCLAIERASGVPPAQYIETNVFHAAKMKDTDCSGTTLAALHEGLKEQSPHSAPGSPTGRANPECSVCNDRTYSTVDDLYRFDRAVTGGTIISRDSLLQMFTPYRDGRGLGWKINKEFDRRLALQDGNANGASVSVRLYPDDDIYIILAADSALDSAKLTRDIAAILFETASKRSVPESPSIK